MRNTIFDRLLSILVICSLSIIVSPLFAHEDGHKQQPVAAEQTIREAATQSIRLLEESSAIYLKEEQKCFSCHHQTMTLMVSKAADRVGIEIDKENSERQLARVAEFYNSRRKRFEPDNLKYPVTPLGYGLWGLDLDSSRFRPPQQPGGQMTLF